METQKEIKEEQVTKHPIRKVKCRAFEVAAWKNEYMTEEGSKEFISCTFQRTYKNKEDEWKKEVINHKVDDIPKMIAALQEMYRDQNLRVE